MNPTTDTTTALALALDGAAAPASDEIKRLSGIAGMVGVLPDPQIDDRFVARLEATLMAEFDAQFGAQEAAQAPPALRVVKPEPTVERETVATPRVAPNVVALPRRRFVVRKALAGMIAAAMLSALPVLAAGSALPGSPFFGIERFRQQHAIDSAHGAQKAFRQEDVARKYIAYGAQFATMGHEPREIAEVLSYANRLQASAAKLMRQVGTKAEIARLAGMLKIDASRLGEILPSATLGARPVVQVAIRNVNALTARLESGLGAIVVPPVASPDTSSGGSVQAPKGEAQPASAGEIQAPAKPGTPSGKEDLDPGRKEYFQTYDPSSCATIGEAQFDDLLLTPSQMLCEARDEGPQGN